jgi:gamma-glutamyltranspeptidase / glutathione hydrolase
MTSAFYARNVVATSQSLGAQAGIDALHKGGNAVDAALATAIALAVVEPVSNGVGGDMFAIVWDGQQLHGLNASGCAPADLQATDYAGQSHVPFTGWASAVLPGAVSGWVALSQKFGKLRFAELFDAAIDYAKNGFPLSPVVSYKWSREALRLKDQPGFAQVFAPNGQAPQTQESFKNPALAKSLQAIAESHGAALYGGDIGQSLVQHAHAHGGIQGARWSVQDLLRQEASWHQPLSVNYRDHQIWQLPPNGQGLAALLSMGLLNHFERGSDDVRWLHLQAECIKQSFAQMYPYLADERHIKHAASDWLTPASLTQLAGQISTNKAANYGQAKPPWGGTVYLTAADAQGCVVSLIQSTFFGFGSGVVDPATGIHLNNRGACFSLDPSHPNCLAGGKRPMNTIIPGFVTKNGNPAYALGVTGGPIQPQGQMQLLSRMIDDQQDPQRAIDAKRWKIEHARGSVQLDLEDGFDNALAKALRELGHREEAPGITGLDFGGAYAVQCLADGAYAVGNDPRRDGAALGF